MSIDGKTQIFILGGGFGGLYAAMHLEKTLARDSNGEVTLINRDNFFRSSRCCTKWPTATWT